MAFKLASYSDIPSPPASASEIPSPLAGEGQGGGYPHKSNHKNYPPYIHVFARSLRQNPTEAEKKFWQMIRPHQTGYKFRRQFTIDGKYIADFICLEKRLIIEIDGGQHSDNKCDKERTFYLESQDFRVIRFWNHEVMENLEGCYTWLIQELEVDTPHPNPPPQGGGNF